jgi:hypothetical protein
MQATRCDGLTGIAATIVFVGVFAIGLAQLYGAQPAEDAFILFKYAENVARGWGIVYYAGGPRTEGATDFLWLMLLAASVAAGVNVAVAALAWNALGAALAAALLDREIAQSGLDRRWRVLFLVTPLSVLLIAGAPAAYLGFSSLLYQGMVLATFVAATLRGGGALDGLGAHAVSSRRCILRGTLGGSGRSHDVANEPMARLRGFDQRRRYARRRLLSRPLPLFRPASAAAALREEPRRPARSGRR